MKSESFLTRESSLLAFTGRHGSLRVLLPVKIGGREVADCTIRRGVLLDGAGARLGSVTFDAKSITIVDHQSIVCLRLDRLGRSEGVCHIEHPVHRGQAWETYLVSLGAGRSVSTTPNLITTPAPTPASSAAGPPPPPLPSTVPTPVVSGAGKGCLGPSILMAGVFAVLFGLIFFLWPSTRTEPAKQLEAERGPVQKMVTDKVPADGTGTTTKQATQKRMSTFVMIAAGSSVVGCVASNNPDLACFNDEPVASPRNFAALEVMRTEVTVAEYGTCVASGHCAKPEPGAGCNYEVKGKEQHPMNCVSWTEAVTWCGFANARLPTPDEWERVARGSTTGVFPWGDAEPNGSRANLCDRNCPNLPSVDEKILPRSKRIQLDVDDGYAGTAPVGSYPEGANSEGVLDLVGNVWEWTDGDWRVGKKERRGGSFIDRPRGLRISNRFGSEPETRSVHTGFRCVR